MKDFIRELKNNSDYIFFYSSFPDNKNPQILLFSKPVARIECRKKSDIEKQLKRLDYFINQGYYIAGYVSYETGLFFNDLPINCDKKFSLFSFGIYEKPKVINRIKITPDNNYVIFDIKRNLSFNQYNQDIKKIKKFLENGEVYQINYCFKEKFRFYGDALDLFFNLVNQQKTKYSAFVKEKNYCILSISPEMFFSVDNNKIVMSQ
jgi:para-aminobenzoate synthetase/4-amino-4-deoxychorismate lyase